MGSGSTSTLDSRPRSVADHRQADGVAVPVASGGVVVAGVVGTAVVVGSAVGVTVGTGVVGNGVVGTGVVGTGVVGTGVVGAGVVGTGVVGAGVVGAGVVGAGVAGAEVVAVGSAVASGPTPAGGRATERGWVVVVVASGVGAVVVGSVVAVGIPATLSDGSGTATWRSPRGTSLAVRAELAGGVDAPPAVTRATPSPEPEMMTAVAMRNAARRPGSSRR